MLQAGQNGELERYLRARRGAANAVDGAGELPGDRRQPRDQRHADTWDDRSG